MNNPLSFKSLAWFYGCLSLMVTASDQRINHGELIIKSKTKAKVPAAFFAFGDSIVDPGNNNGIITLSKANFPPYGKDFLDGKPTGRFSNGRIPTDFLVKALGIKEYLPAYLDPSLQEKDLLTGVSFASGACGFDSLTSSLMVAKSMEDQVKMFKEYIGRIKRLVGDGRTNFILNDSITFLTAGSDDIAINYFDFPFRRLQYDVPSYTDLMINSASSFIKKLYKLGIRKICVTNVPPVGCIPSQRTLGGGLTRDCGELHNQAAQLFNTKLQGQLQFLSTKLPNSKLVYVDVYSMVLDLVVNAPSYGFEVWDRGCCGSGLIEVAVLCNSFSWLCENTSKYLFWDSFHPTEAGYQILSNKIAEKYLHNFF